MIDQYALMAQRLMRVKTTEQIIEDYEAFTNPSIGEQFVFIIDWLKAELERRDKEAFTQWMSTQPGHSPRQFFIK